MAVVLVVVRFVVVYLNMAGCIAVTLWPRKLALLGESKLQGH